MLARDSWGSTTRDSGDRLVDLTFHLVAVIAAVLFAAFSLGLPPNVDPSLLLNAADRVLGGERLYVDVIETNPPLIVFLSIPAAALARITPIPAILAFNLGIMALIALSLTLSVGILGRRVPGLGRESSRVVLIVLFVVALPLVGYDFGQREHLALLLVLPYLCSAIMRRLGYHTAFRAAVLAGVMAGLGISLKPFFLPLWLGIEGYLALTVGMKSWRRAESVAIFGVFAAYAAAICLLTPSYFDVARWVAQTYGAFISVPRKYLLTSRPVIWSVIWVALTWLVPANKEWAAVRSVLSITFVAYLSSFIVQGKGWPNHWYPARASAAIVVAIGACRLGGILRDFGNRRASHISLPTRLRTVGRLLIRHRTAMLALILLHFGSQLAIKTANRYGSLERFPWYLPQMLTTLERIAPGGSVSALSVYPQVGFPLVNLAEREWASRFFHLWWLPGVYADQVGQDRPVSYHPLEEQSELERELLDMVVDDFLNRRPEILIVDTHQYMWMPLGFDHLDYFGRDPRFAEEISAYSPAAMVYGFHVYVRRDSERPTTDPAY